MLDFKEKKKLIGQLVDGLNFYEIADNWGVSKRTIERHIESIKEQHGAKNLSHLIGIYFRKKLIS